MNEIITLEMLLDLPKELLKKSIDYNEYAVLLDKEQYSKYDYKDLKEKVNKYFTYFKNLKYFYQFPTNYEISMNTTYDSIKVSATNRISDPVSNLVTKEIDEKIRITNWMTKFYNAILVIASKLTVQEATYLVDCFFSNKSEDVTCEKLGICRNTLQKIKKSCIVKSWIELQTLELPKDV